MSIRMLAERLLDRLQGTEPLHVAIGTAVGSLLLVAASAMVGVFSYSPGGRQVGYATSLNWAIGFTLVAPFYYFFLFTTLQQMPLLGQRLSSAGMLLDSNLEPHPAGATLAAGRWTTIRRRYALVWLCLSIIGLLWSLWEWWEYCGRALLVGGRVGGNEQDWSVALVDAARSKQWIGAIFSLLVFLQQVFLIAMIALLLYFAFSFAAYVRDLRQTGRAIRLFPAKTFAPADPRCGFQIFSTIFSPFLLAGASLYAHFLLSRLWNAYLHSPATAGNDIWEFLRDGFIQGAQGLSTDEALNKSILGRIQDLGALDLSGLMVALGAILLFLISLSLLVVVLRGAAKDSRRELLASGIRGAARDRVDKMVFWPMRFPGLTTLLAVGFLAVLGMAAYRVAILFLGLAFGIALQAAIAQVWSRR